MNQEVSTTASAWGATGAAYERFSEHFADALMHCVQRLAPRQGEQLLDVATGTGWTARLLASRGARVTGIDFSADQIASARALAQKYGMEIAFDVGDAHHLPYADGQFDAVISTFGVIFASQPVIAAQELARVCRRGGRLALAVWSENCSLGVLTREVAARYSPVSPNPPPSPYKWGSEARLRELLEPGFELRIEPGCSVLREPDGNAVWQLWKEAHGLTATRLKTLDHERQEAFRRDFIAFHEQYRVELGIAMPRDYLIAIGIRK